MNNNPAANKLTIPLEQSRLLALLSLLNLLESPTEELKLNLENFEQGVNPSSSP